VGLLDSVQLPGVRPRSEDRSRLVTGSHGRPMICLTMNEIRRLQVLLCCPARPPGHHPHWSTWRRRHQARPPCAAARAMTADPGGERGMGYRGSRRFGCGAASGASGSLQEADKEIAALRGQMQEATGRSEAAADTRPQSGSCTGGRAARAPDAFRPGGDARRAAELPGSAAGQARRVGAGG
jgi:hypothetical protein